MDLFSIVQRLLMLTLCLRDEAWEDINAEVPTQVKPENIGLGDGSDDGELVQVVSS